MNENDQILCDLLYWEDPSDEKKANLGSLLPLWTISDLKDKQVSKLIISSNSYVAHVFAVARTGANLVMIYSFQDISKPIRILETSSSISMMSFSDADKSQASYLATGLENGEIEMFDLTTASSTCFASFRCGSVLSRVTQICWAKRYFVFNGDVAFYTLRENDEKLDFWTAADNSSEIIHSGSIGDDLLQPQVFTCFDCHPDNGLMFLIGTQQGTILKLNHVLREKPVAEFDLDVVEGSFFIEQIKLIHACPRCIIVVGSDNAMRLLDDCGLTLLVFRFSSKIRDLSLSLSNPWAFFIAEEKGILTCFNLFIRLDRPLCQQKVSPADFTSAVTCTNFYDLVLTVDSSGVIGTFKPSPNLRKHNLSQDSKEMTEIMDSLVTKRLNVN